MALIKIQNQLWHGKFWQGHMRIKYTIQYILKISGMSVIAWEEICMRHREGPEDVTTI